MPNCPTQLDQKLDKMAMWQVFTRILPTGRVDAPADASDAFMPRHLRFSVVWEPDFSRGKLTEGASTLCDRFDGVLDRVEAYLEGLIPAFEAMHVSERARKEAEVVRLGRGNHQMRARQS